MRRKIILSVLSILILLCTVSLIYEKINKDKTSEGMFAIYLEKEKDTGKYEKSNLKTWPTEEEYAINMQKTYCENGSVLRWNLETRKINVTVKGTDKCYVYFDKAEYGSKEHPHLIQTIEDLVRLSNDVNSGTTYAGKYFLLTNDLDFKDPSDYEDSQRLDFLDINGINGNEALIEELTTGSGFVPIGSSETNSFQGVFDGNNKEIANLYINNVTKNYIGLFGYIKAAKINNLTITGNINSSRAVEAGGISGQGLNFIITNCQNKANITVNTASQSVGGFLGSSKGISTIQNSQNYGNISNGNNTGGFLGTNGGTLTIRNSQNYGSITNNSGAHAGGIIGRDNAATSETIIIDSHNEGLIKGINYAGGLIGRTYGKAVINKSYNSNLAVVSGLRVGGLIGEADNSVDIQNSYNLANVKFLSEDQGAWVGGIIGNLHNNEKNTLINVYNAGEISGNFRVGGLIGLLSADTIINKSYNLGNIVGYNISSTTYFYLGGLVSHIYDATNSYKLIILNSYNLGNLMQRENTTNDVYMGGLVFQNTFPCEVKIINSYNAGDITSKNGDALGIIRMWSNTALNNVFNIGKIKGGTSYGIGRIKHLEQVTIKNTYYENSVSASDVAEVTATPMAIDDMKNQAFVDELNSNAFNIDLKTVDSSLVGYTLSLWKLGENGYPIFADDIIDLSGKGNNGLDFSVSKSSEGITTSDETKNGYINMGLANYDFGDSLSYVVRVKFNNINGYQEFMGNWEDGGGGFSLYTNGLIRFNQYVPEMDPNDYYRTGYSKTTIEANKWYTIIGTYDGTNIKLYINGEEAASSPLTGKVKPSPTYMALGGNPNNKNVIINYSYTTFSDALVFDRALTKEEIAQNYRDIPNPINKDELLVWYKF